MLRRLQAPFHVRRIFGGTAGYTHIERLHRGRRHEYQNSTGQPAADLESTLHVNFQQKIRSPGQVLLNRLFKSPVIMAVNDGPLQESIF